MIFTDIKKDNIYKDISGPGREYILWLCIDEYKKVKTFNCIFYLGGDSNILNVEGECSEETNFTGISYFGMRDDYPEYFL